MGQLQKQLLSACLEAEEFFVQTSYLLMLLAKQSRYLLKDTPFHARDT